MWRLLFYMAYATQSDLTARFPAALLVELADRDNSGTADSGVIDAALADAGGEIDLYIGEAYDLPLSSTPQYLVLANCEMAIYRLAFTADLLTEEITKRYERHIMRLGKIACGKLSLGIEDDESDAMDATVTSDNDRDFNRCTLKGLF